MNATEHTRENLTGKRGLKPRQEELIAISPDRIFWIHGSGAASFVVDELRRNTCTHHEISEIVSIDVRLYLLPPQMEVVLAELLRNGERKLQGRSRIT
jgi:hypothetical protein